MKRFTRKLHALREDLHLIEMVRSAFSALIIRILGAASAFALSVSVARLFGVSGSGTFYLIVGILTVLATVSRFGLDNTVVKYVSYSTALVDWSSIKVIYKFSIQITLVCSLTISFLLFAFSEQVAHYLFHNPELVTPLKFSSFALPPLAIGLLHAEFLRGLRKIIYSQFIKTGAVSIGTLCVIYPLAHAYNLNGAFTAYLLAATLAMCVSLWQWHTCFTNLSKQTSPIKANNQPVTEALIFQSAWPMFGVVIAGLVVQNGLTIMLGLWSNVNEIGVFSVSSQITSILIFPLMASVSVLAPKFAALHREGKDSEIRKLAKQSSLILTCFVLPVALLVYLYSHTILALFGNGFTNGTIVLRILIVGVVLNVATGAVAELLVMTGHERAVRKIHFLGAIVVITTGGYLIPHFSSVGAATTSAIGYGLINVLMVLTVRKKLGFWPIGFNLKECK